MGSFYSTQRVEVDDSDSSDMDSETEDFVADAAKTVSPLTLRQSRLPSFQSVTETHVMEIEKNLETYEKVSLTYLLYGEPHIALQNVNILLADKNYNNLIDWVKYERSLGNKWQEKLIEALTIIQNYEVLRKLGFMKKDMYERFLPLTKTKTLFVNPLRKCLYRMCEDFTKKDTLRFLSLAEKDLKDLPEYNVGDVYLEKYLLYFETEKYITCNEVNDADVKNIIKICKYMELDNLQNELEVFSSSNKIKRATEEKVKPGVSSRNSSTDSGDEQFDLEEFDKTPGLSSGKKVVKSKGKKAKIPQPQVSSHTLGKETYDISPENPGIVVIINNEHFYSEYRRNLTKLLPSPKQLEQREGTEEDKKNLMDTFEHFRFKVVCFDDLTHEAIKSKIRMTVKEIDKESSFFVVILSHGDEGVVYGTNSIPLKVSEIQNIMCAPALAGKPKVLILQCCQGIEVQDLMKTDDLATDGPLPAPKTSDMFVFWATVPGYSAIRHKKSGTWFIQALCKMMKQKPTYHFQDICVFTQKEVTEKRWDHKVMVPLVETTLSKFLYLPNPNVK